MGTSQGPQAWTWGHMGQFIAGFVACVCKLSDKTATGCGPMLFKAGIGPCEWYSMDIGVRGLIGLMALALMLWYLSLWAFEACTMHDECCTPTAHVSML